MRRRTSVALGAGVLLAGAAAGVLAAEWGRAARRPDPLPPPPTVAVRRGDLEQAQQVNGELGYGAPWTVTGRGGGIVTWLPPVGAKVSRGQQLYRVDDAPVSVFYGGLPLYRTLRYRRRRPAQTGHDVDVVAANLKALGYYGGSTTAAAYDAVLAGAVRAWQRSIGRPATGAIAPASIVVTPGAVRVSGVSAHLADPAAEQLLALTTTAKTITLELPPTLAQSLPVGRRLRVTLAGGKVIAGRISQMGTAASSAGGDQGAGQSGVPVTVAPVHPGVLAHAPAGAVSADIVTAARRGALYVPVTALLALSGGGYALERPNRRLVRVRLGMVAGGEVQVTGVRAGARVVVAQ